MNYHPTLPPRCVLNRFREEAARSRRSRAACLILLLLAGLAAGVWGIVETLNP